MPLGCTSAPDIPNSTRKAISDAAFHDRAHRAVVMTEPTSPTMNTLRWPWMSPSLPPRGVNTAMASMRPVTIQPSVVRLVSRSVAMTASDTVTMVIREPNPMTAAITVSSSFLR